MDWKHKLRVNTTSPEWLWKMVLAIVLAGVAIGFVVQFLPFRSDSLLDDAIDIYSSGDASDFVEYLKKASADPKTRYEDLLRVLSTAAQFSKEYSEEAVEFGLNQFDIEAAEIDPALRGGQLSESQVAIGAALWRSVMQGRLVGVLATTGEDSGRYVKHAIGEFWFQQKEYSQAGDAYRLEGENPEAESSREWAVTMYEVDENLKALDELTDLPEYQSLISPRVRCRLAKMRQDWWNLWWCIPKTMFSDKPLGPVCLAMIGGLGWFAFSIQAGQWWHPRGSRWWLCILAVLLGILSIWPTRFLITWQEVNWGLEDSMELVPGLKYFIAGVGLREELSKLLCFVPLLPFVMKRRCELEVLTLAACVGLGFAILENVNYFIGDADATLGRFLTANFYHMASTAIRGLALTRACWHGRQRILDAIAIFVIIVFAHGIYDAFIVLPGLAEYGIVALVVDILIAYQFFHELRRMRAQSQETISLTAIFLACVSLLGSATLVYLASRDGWASAIRSMVSEILSLMIIVIMFLREVPGSLIR